MTGHSIHGILIVLLAVVPPACSSQPSESDRRIAELQKELDSAKEQIAAAAHQPAPPADDPAAQPRATPSSGTPAAGQPDASPGAPRRQPADGASLVRAEQTARQRELTQQAAGAGQQASRDHATTEQALKDQRVATARQAEETADLRRQLEEMKPREFTLPAGTAIPVRTTAEISTSSVSNGSVFEALLERDLVIDGTTLAIAGSRVTCVVVASDPGGKVRGLASLSVGARSIAAADGNSIVVRTDSYSVDARSTAGKDATRTGIATGAGAVIGAIAGGGKGAAIGAGAGAAAGVGATLATRGEPAVIPTETLIEFRLAAPALVVFRK